MQKILWLCAALYAGGGLHPALGQPVEKVRVVLFRVPEKRWQTELESLSADPQALWKSLNDPSSVEDVQRALDVECALPGDQTSFEWRRGLDEEFTTSWRSDPAKIEVLPAKSTKRFVGTSLSVASHGLTRGGQLAVALRLEHDIRPPVMTKHNYANAAEGKERERLSVEYPQFEKIAWQGAAVTGREWRLVAQVLQTADAITEGSAARRYLLFITRL